MPALSRRFSLVGMLAMTFGAAGMFAAFRYRRLLLVMLPAAMLATICLGAVLVPVGMLMSPGKNGRLDVSSGTAGAMLRLWFGIVVTLLSLWILLSGAEAWSNH